MNLIHDICVFVGLTFLIGCLVIASMIAGQSYERDLLEQVCKVNGQIVINDVLYQCGEIGDLK